jgi:hypothetical protein
VTDRSAPVITQSRSPALCVNCSAVESHALTLGLAPKPRFLGEEILARTKSAP